MIKKGIYNLTNYGLCNVLEIGIFEKTMEVMVVFKTTDGVVWINSEVDFIKNVEGMIKKSKVGDNFVDSHKLEPLSVEMRDGEVKNFMIKDELVTIRCINSKIKDGHRCELCFFRIKNCGCEYMNCRGYERYDNEYTYYEEIDL